MKKLLAAVLTLCMLFGSVPVFAETAPAGHQIESGEYDLYDMKAENKANQPVTLWFVDGVKDLPYIELRDWGEIMYFLYEDEESNNGYGLTANWDGPMFTFTRETGFYMTADFEKGTIRFNDFDAFMQKTASTLVSPLSLFSYDSEGRARLLEVNKTYAYERYGDELVLDLKSYGIEMIYQDGKYLVPLQTLSDFLMIPFTVSMLFNGQALFIANADSLMPEDTLSPLGELYYAAPAGERSPELAAFGFRELCLMMDNVYGLKNTHDIRSFTDLFWQIGLESRLSGSSAEEADLALNELINFHLDDLHSFYGLPSYLTGMKLFGLADGMSRARYEDISSYYRSVRDRFNLSPYQEVGDTAYVILDGFSAENSPKDYYEKDFDDLIPDTFSTIIYAHQRISREDSPIRNVVLDLSCNGGGQLNAAAFVLAWFLGNGELSLRDTMTGAVSTTGFRADVNLDGVYDGKDTVFDKNLFCVISPVSFSCGNLLPSVFKASQYVTLIGRTSGGGSCLVQNTSTAWGTMISISSPYQMSFVKNGSFYDIDRGVEPDVFVSNPVNIYERETLTDIIHGVR